MQRRSTGGVRKQRGRWIGLWRENGVKKSKILGLTKEMTKGEAREAVAAIIADLREEKSGTETFENFVKQVYIPFFSRKWKQSTQGKTINRIEVHLLRAFKDCELSIFRRDGLQDFLDEKAKTLSFSVVNHLRWDLKAIFDMAVAEGVVERNPATLLFTPKAAAKPERATMSIANIREALGGLEKREALICRLAILAGMRPGEIFALRWGRIGDAFAEVTERVYEGVLDTPKTDKSIRNAALTDGLVASLEEWRQVSPSTSAEAFVFPSERGTPLSKHNVWRRNIQPNLKKVGLAWCTFQVMRRTHSTLMKNIKADPKLVADQLGHTVDVNQNVYTQSSVELRLPLDNELEKLIL
jgi:integrase